MKNIAVILGGCGQLDGSEIHESVLTLLAIKQIGANYSCFSINDEQHLVVDHLTSKTIQDDRRRNMLVESARIARGKITALDSLVVDEFDGLIIPGGNGIASNLFDFAEKGINFTVNSLVKKTCLAFFNTQKPVGFLCISAMMALKIYSQAVKITIGNDNSLIEVIEKLGSNHQMCSSHEVCVDDSNIILTSPAYMLANDIFELNIGIFNLVQKLYSLI